MVDLTSITALTFDCYGTLVDWETGLESALRPVLEVFSADCTREMVMQDYARFEAQVEAEVAGRAWRSYGDVLCEVAERMFVEYGVPPGAVPSDVLSTSLPDWPLFPDTVEALRRLRRHVPLGVVSNVDADLFAGTARHLAGDGENPFTWVVTAGEVRAYKPDPAMFAAARQTLGEAAGGWLHAAQSLYHDIRPARQLGVACVHVVRRGAGATPDLGDDARADLVVPDLAALADAFDAARG